MKKAFTILLVLSMGFMVVSCFSYGAAPAEPPRPPLISAPSRSPSPDSSSPFSSSGSLDSSYSSVAETRDWDNESSVSNGTTKRYANYDKQSGSDGLGYPLYKHDVIRHSIGRDDTNGRIDIVSICETMTGVEITYINHYGALGNITFQVDCDRTNIMIKNSYSIQDSVNIPGKKTVEIIVPDSSSVGIVMVNMIKK